MDISRAVSREPHPLPHRVILRAVDCRRGWFAVHSNRDSRRFSPGSHRCCTQLVSFLSPT
jgi:hypothetical protein